MQRIKDPLKDFNNLMKETVEFRKIHGDEIDLEQGVSNNDNIRSKYRLQSIKYTKNKK